VNIGKDDNLLSRNIIAKADQLYQSGQCDPAVDLLVAAIENYGGESSLQYKLAEILIDSQQYMDALETLEQIFPSEDNFKKLEFIGLCKLKLGFHEEAGAIADRILCVPEGSAPALNIKGVLAFKQGDKNSAIDYFKKAIAVDPNYGNSYSNLGAVDWVAAKYSEALGLFEKGFLLSPLVREVVFAYHDAVKAQAAYQRAELTYKGAVHVYPCNKRLLYLLIEILLQQAKHEEGMNYIEKAIAAFGIDDGILPAAHQIRTMLGPQEIGEDDDHKGSVSLCMVVRNEEKFLAKSLGSVKPIMDEIIVVDTGSEDATRNIAEVFGAKVFDYHWDNDFSKARNYSLSKADGEWIFILDADEVISSLDYAPFKALIGNGKNGSVAYSIVTRNYTLQANTVGWIANDEKYRDVRAGSGWFASEKVRLFKNDARIRFEYPVHEMVDPVLNRLGVPIKECSIPVHHYGKLNAETSARKTEAYYNIGKKKLALFGDNTGALRELAIQAGHLEKHEEAVELWHQFIQLKPDNAEAFVNMGTAYWNLGKYDQAAISARKAIELAPDMKEAHFNYAISQLHLGNAPDAVAVLENVLSQHPGYQAAEFMLAAAYCCAGQKDRAVAGFEKIRLTAVGPVLAVTFCDLATKLRNASQNDYAIVLLQTAIDCGVEGGDIGRLLRETMRQ
jgi:tetratricopeptide (TPR) repeat protein